MTYYNWHATTGLPFVDFAFAHCLSVPPEERQYYVERVLCPQHPRGGYALPEGVPPVSDPPHLTNGHITIGSFAGSHKMNDSVLSTWARLLVRNPTWRLVLKNATLDDSGFRSRIRSAFVRSGVKDPDRLSLRGTSAFLAMLDEYRDLDIALDTWGFGGGSTVLWALCQGVPVVAMGGNRSLARNVEQLLRYASLPDLVACDEQDYISRVEQLAADSERLCELRRSLRDRYQGGPGALEAVARDWEHTLRAAWRDWCAARDRRPASL
jgi:predicted O-linked N-acetylglucosamine transferase (SPINDLY family)